MTSRLPVPIPGGVRFGPCVRLAAAVVLAALSLLGAGSGAGAVPVGRTDGVRVAFHRTGSADVGALRQARFDPATKKEDLPDGRTRRGEQEDSFADRAADRGRALLDRYGSETILRAVVIGALVQVLCLVLVRMVGTVLRFAARGLAWSTGVAVALYLLDGPASLPASAVEAVGWLGRLADQVARAA